jgi:hypothetical protein
MKGLVSCATCLLGATIQTLNRLLNFDPTAPENSLDLLQKNARTAIKFFTGILPSFSDETEHSHSMFRRPPTGCDPLMHGSA